MQELSLFYSNDSLVDSHEVFKTPAPTITFNHDDHIQLKLPRAINHSNLSETLPNSL